MKRSFIFLLLIFSFHLFSQTDNQEIPKESILIIYDASGSMWGKINDEIKHTIATEIVSKTIERLPSNQKIGLMAYGHRRKGDCSDVEFLVTTNNTSKNTINDAIQQLKPLGKTPLARSVNEAFTNLKNNEANATIILITDGIESCEGDLCQATKNAKKSGIDFKLHIVGFGLKDEDKSSLICAAEAGGGEYFDADGAVSLEGALHSATTPSSENKSPNFSLQASKNGEHLDVWIKARSLDSSEVEKMSRSYQDSAWLYLPEGRYEIEVLPLENTDLTSTKIHIIIDEARHYHESVSFDSGTLIVEAKNNENPLDAIFKLYPLESKKIKANSRTYGRQQDMEVDPGIYKLTVQALKIKGLENFYEYPEIEIKSNSETKVIHEFESGLVKIGVKTSGGELVDATVNFYEKQTGENIAANRTYTSDTSNPKSFVLSPGEYLVKIVTLGKHKGQKFAKNISLKKGESLEHFFQLN